MTINGRAFDGPLYVARRITLGEISFVDLGADTNTTARIAAQQQESQLMDETKDTEVIETTKDADATAREVAGDGHSTGPDAAVGVVDLQGPINRTLDTPPTLRVTMRSIAGQSPRSESRAGPVEAGRLDRHVAVLRRPDLDQAVRTLDTRHRSCS